MTNNITDLHLQIEELRYDNQQMSFHIAQREEEFSAQLQQSAALIIQTLRDEFSQQFSDMRDAYEAKTDALSRASTSTSIWKFSADDSDALGPKDSITYSLLPSSSVLADRKNVTNVPSLAAYLRDKEPLFSNIFSAGNATGSNFIEASAKGHGAVRASLPKGDDATHIVTTIELISLLITPHQQSDMRQALFNGLSRDAAAIVHLIIDIDQGNGLPATYHNGQDIHDLQGFDIISAQLLEGSTSYIQLLLKLIVS